MTFFSYLRFIINFSNTWGQDSVSTRLSTQEYEHKIDASEYKKLYASGMWYLSVVWIDTWDNHVTIP